MVSIEQNIYLSIYDNGFTKPENYNLESLFLLDINQRIQDTFLYIKNNCVDIFFTYENFLYKVCYISSAYYFLFIDIRIFMKNGLYYCEIKKRDGRDSDMTEFLNLFNKTQNNTNNFVKINDLPETITQDLHEIIDTTKDEDCRKNTYSYLMNIFYQNESSFQKYSEFYCNRLKIENDWESTYFLCYIIFKITTQENSKKHILILLEKLYDILDSKPNSRKKMVLKLMKSCILSIFSQYKESFLEDTTLISEKIENYLEKIKFDF